MLHHRIQRLHRIQQLRHIQRLRHIRLLHRMQRLHRIRRLNRHPTRRDIRRGSGNASELIVPERLVARATSRLVLDLLG